MSELDPETQFQNGIKMILSAHDTTVSFLTSEVSRLNKELSQKNKELRRLEELCAQLLKEKATYEETISGLRSRNDFDEKMTKFSADRITPRLSLTKEKLKSGNFIPANKKENGSNSSNSIQTLFQDYKLNHKKQKIRSANSSVLLGDFKKMSRANSTCSSVDCGGDFFKKCRSVMTPSEYTEMIEVIKLFNSKKISKEETYRDISQRLNEGKYKELVKDFKNLFV